MKQLLESTIEIAAAFGITGDPTPVEKGWKLPEGWLVLAGLIPDSSQGPFEFAIAINQVAVDKFDRDDDAFEAIVACLEPHGNIIAGCINGTLGDEAQVELKVPVVIGFTVKSKEGQVAVLMGGAIVPIDLKAAKAAAGVSAGADDHGSDSGGGGHRSKLLGDGVRLLGDVEMEVTAELGRTSLTVRELLSLVPGSVVELDRIAGAPIDVLVNGTVIARGEVVVVDEEFGVRITEILDPDLH